MGLDDMTKSLAMRHNRLEKRLAAIDYALGVQNFNEIKTHMQLPDTAVSDTAVAEIVV